MPAEVEKSWNITHTYTGSANKNTDTFTILGESFKVDWLHQGEGHFAIVAYSGDGEHLELLTNDIGTGAEVTNVYERGEVYLEISASDTYEINILEYQ